MQVKLLRLLETGTYRRVGSTEQRQADIRVVSATHRDLDQMVVQGKFREDLYYRLSTFPIHLPALRERRDDIALLANALLQRVAHRRKLRLCDDALGLLVQQDYPGNVRELRNLLERAALLCDGESLEAAHIDQALRLGRRPVPPATIPTSPPATLTNSRKAAESATLQAHALAHQGSRAELAAKLGISERSLYRKLKALKPR